MNEELMKKLVEVLKSRGLSDEDIESVKLELTEKTEDKKTPEEPKDDDVPTPPTKESKEPEEEAKVEEKEEQPAETNDGGEKVEEKEEVSEEDKVEETPAPAPEEENNNLPEGVKEFDPENPSVEEQPSPEAPASPDYEAMYNELKSQLEEERNARAGLEARLESALSALEESGVISSAKPSASPIGVHDPAKVDDFHEHETTMDAVLKDINLK